MAYNCEFNRCVTVGVLSTMPRVVWFHIYCDRFQLLETKKDTEVDDYMRTYLACRILETIA